MELLSLVPDWLQVHGAALLVVLPLMMGAVLAVMPSERLSWALAMIVTLLCSLFAFVLVLQVAGGDRLVYSMGGWDPPHGTWLPLYGDRHAEYG